MPRRDMPVSACRIAGSFLPRSSCLGAPALNIAEAGQDRQQIMRRKFARSRRRARMPCSTASMAPGSKAGGVREAFGEMGDEEISGSQRRGAKPGRFSRHLARRRRLLPRRRWGRRCIASSARQFAATAPRSISSEVGASVPFYAGKRVARVRLSTLRGWDAVSHGSVSRSAKRVNSPSKNRSILPVGPWRCLARISSALL